MGWNLLISLIVKLITQYLANRRSEEVLKNLGASTQREDSRRKAEIEERRAREAAAAAQDGPDDPRDLRD